MFERYEKYAPLVIRAGLGTVWLLFGVDKFVNPLNWMGYIPAWLPLPIAKEVFMGSLAVVETVVGAGLILGIFTRFFAGLAALMLLPIMYSLGYNEISIRDFALFCMSVAMFLRRSTPYAIENRWKRKGN